MVSDRLSDAYVPDLVPESDLEYFDQAGCGARVGWGDSPAIVIVDLTIQFSDGEYPLGRSDTGDAAVEANRQLLAGARAVDLPVVYLRGLDAGDRWPSAGRGRIAKDVGEPFDPGDGNQIRPEIAPQDDDAVIRKPGRSAFFETRLDALLRAAGIDTVVVTGMVTSGCVRATVVDAFERNYHTIVPPECVADRGVVSHEISLFDMDMKYADVTPLDGVLDELRRYG